MVHNWLSAAYSRFGDMENAERIAKLNYQRNPNYLFAKLNFATFCLRRGELEKVAAIFDGKFDLHLLYPHRDVFHITEFVGFCGVIVEYLLRSGELDAAQILFKTLEKIAPEDETTRKMREVMSGSLLLRLVRDLSSRLPRRRQLPR